VVGLQKLAQLLEGQTVVPVSVDSPDDLNQLLLQGIGAMRSQEGAQVASRDEAALMTLNRVESLVQVVVAAGQQFVLELLDLALKANFLLNNCQERVLDVVRQVVETATAHSMSIQGDVAQAVILAGQEHLQETKKSC
jgi:hypothetical protein